MVESSTEQITRSRVTASLLIFYTFKYVFLLSIISWLSLYFFERNHNHCALSLFRCWFTKTGSDLQRPIKKVITAAFTSFIIITKGRNFIDTLYTQQCAFVNYCSDLTESSKVLQFILFDCYSFCSFIIYLNCVIIFYLNNT